MKISKNNYLAGFTLVVLLLAVIRLVFPGVARESGHENNLRSEVREARVEHTMEEAKEDHLTPHSSFPSPRKHDSSRFFSDDGTPAKLRIFGVPS